MKPDESNNSRLKMLRENLEGIPDFTLPSGFALRWYVPGDEAFWFAIHQVADRYNSITKDLFQQQFGTNQARLAERQCYLIAPNGKAIGTATAWFGHGPELEGFGRVHWVALLPDYQGRGLSKPLLASVCTRLRELGHQRAYLSTSTERKRAIQLYLRFGFVPWIQNEPERKLWSEILSTQQALTDS
jgi:GNAT superfamily N-acetyltransferase